MPLVNAQVSVALAVTSSTKRYHGSALLEVLVSIGIAAIIFASLFPSYRFLLNYHKGQSAQLRAANSISKALNTIQHDATSANTIAGFNNIKTHPQGSFTTTSGSSQFLPNTSVSLAPHPSSNAISFRHLDAKTLLVASEATEASNEILLTACSPHSSVASVTNWLIVAPTGYLHTQGTLRRARADSSICISENTFKGTLRPTADPVFGNTLESTKHLATPFLLIPIEQNYTLYIDRNETFRRVSHNSLENQPIELELGTLAIDQIDTSPNAALLKITIRNSTSLSNRSLEESIFLRVNVDDSYARLNMLR
jgi:type II secretory pathway pseudopilin PulG